ncbi:MAG: hypothetical protein M1817_002036 [Caeruleum heppii]|nr:MAG: hypothetical protein M1817_002036 [Caeruleum heppii]
MAGKKAAGENSKKASGNAKKAEVAAQKAAAETASKAKVEDEEWGKGAKSSAKKDAAEAKKADAARKKAEKDALLAEEEQSLKAAKPTSNKAAPKKSRGTLDLGDLDSDASSSKQATSLNATGIDNALDALSLTGSNADKIDKHPERRFKAAYAAYEARRMPELEEETKGLRRQQRIDMIRKEFEKSPENPFNQVNAKYDMSKEEIATLRKAERDKVEQRLADK